MGILEFIRAVAALAVTLGLIGLAAVALRRFGPDFIARMQAGRAERRLQLIETLVLDPSRRLVLVRLDDQERLILLGDGHVLGEPPPVRKTAPVKPAAQKKAIL